MYLAELAVALDEADCLRMNRDLCAVNGEIVFELGTCLLLKPAMRLIVKVGDSLAEVVIDDDDGAVLPVFNEHKLLDHFQVRATTKARSWLILRNFPGIAWRCCEPYVDESTYTAEVKRSWDRHCQEIEEQLKRNGGDL